MERTRWQYAVVNIGTFNTADRLVGVLGTLGADGWELVHVLDKSSNWLAGLEKGFALFKRPVAADEQPEEGWAVRIDKEVGTIKARVPPVPKNAPISGDDWA